MTNNKKLSFLISMMIIINIVIIVFMNILLYHVSLNEQRERLSETAKSWVKLVEAVAEFDYTFKDKLDIDPFDATLSKIVSAYSNYKGFGKTGEFTLARKENDQIVFLLNHRYYDMDQPKPVPFNSNIAEPMRQALSSKSGTIIDLDYRGVRVLAAYEPIKILDLGIVVKMDIAEIKRPFIISGLTAGFISLLLILGVAAIMFNSAIPVITRLEEKERRFAEFMEHLPGAASVVDKEGKLLFFNEYYQKNLNSLVEFTTGSHYQEFLPEQQCEYFKSQDDKVINQKNVFIFEDEIDKDDHRQIWLTTKFPITRENMEIEVGAISLNVTDRKNIILALQENERQLHTLMSNLPGMVYKCRNDENWTMEFVSSGCKSLTGYAVDELVNNRSMTYNDLIYSEDKKAVRDQVQKGLQTQSHYNIIYRIITKSGVLKWVWENGCGVLDKTGNLITLEGFITDITERVHAEEAQKQNEALYKSLIQNIPNGVMFLIDANLRFILAEGAAMPSIELLPNMWIGKNIHDVFPGDLADIIKTVLLNTINGEKQSLELEIENNFYLVQTTPVYTNGENDNYALALTQNISYLKNIEKALRANELKFRTLIEKLPIGIAVVNLDDFNITYLNKKFEQVYGWSRLTIDNYFSMLDLLLTNIEQRESFKEQVLADIHSEEPGKMYWNDLKITRSDGRISYVSGHNIVITQLNIMMTTVWDVTERKLAQEKLLGSLTEKEIMLKEIHHRVKNNLQIVISLLNLQSHTIKDKQALEAIKTSTQRIYSMALVHENLYNNENYAKINIKQYVESMLAELEKAYNVNGNIKYICEIDDFLLGIDQAIPCGLLLNELVTNSIKHAFIDREYGTLNISFKHFNNALYELTVKDDGTGFAASVNLNEPNTLGLRMVNVLTEQLNGVIHIEQNNGTLVRITFKNN